MQVKTGLYKLPRLYKNLLLFFITCIFTVMSNQPVSAQGKTPYVRIAKIVINSARLENYKTALKEAMEAAVRLEPGVMTLYAVYDKDNPAHVTVFEIYADKDAYALHIQTPHFKKYKAASQNMVKHLELTDVVPIALETKPK